MNQDIDWNPKKPAQLSKNLAHWEDVVMKNISTELEEYLWEKIIKSDTIRINTHHMHKSTLDNLVNKFGLKKSHRNDVTCSQSIDAHCFPKMTLEKMNDLLAYTRIYSRNFERVQLINLSFHPVTTPCGRNYEWQAMFTWRYDPDVVTNYKTTTIDVRDDDDVYDDVDTEIIESD